MSEPEQPSNLPDKYEIANLFSLGFVAALKPAAINPDAHAAWHAGYNAGYAFRGRKNEKLNEYLVSIGLEPMGVVRLAGNISEVHPMRDETINITISGPTGCGKTVAMGFIATDLREMGYRVETFENGEYSLAGRSTVELEPRNVRINVEQEPLETLGDLIIKAAMAGIAVSILQTDDLNPGRTELVIRLRKIHPQGGPLTTMRVIPREGDAIPEEGDAAATFADCLERFNKNYEQGPPKGTINQYQPTPSLLPGDDFASSDL